MEGLLSKKAANDIVRLSDANQPIAVSHLSQHLCNPENDDASIAVLRKHANRGRIRGQFCFQITEIILMIRARCARSPMVGVKPWAWRAQYVGSTPRSPSFFAKESLRFAALAAVSVAAWMALGPLLAAALISPNL